MVPKVRARRFIRLTPCAGILCCGLIAGCGLSRPTSLPVTSGGSPAQPNAVKSGAQLGLAWAASDGTLRPVVGVPGSAQFGSSVLPAGSYANAAYSAQSQIALVIDKSGNLYVLPLGSSQPVLLTQGIASNTAIRFSPLGNYAIVYTPSAANLISGLPAQPVVSSIQEGSAIQAAAVSDAGTALLASSAGSGIAITAVAAGGSKTSVATLSGFGGMSFLPGSEDMLLADSAANTLTRIHASSVQMLATAKDGLNQPLAVAASLDGHYAVTANRADGTLVRVDLITATPAVKSTCSCTPSMLTPLNGNAVFELTAPGSTPSWMIEADALVPRVLFIPAARHS
jgi:DNA-binding beta-propeller fold protein YncE